MAGYYLSCRRTVWMIILTLSTVHCAARHRRNQSIIHRTDSSLTCESYGRCCLGSVLECGPEKGSTYCNCDEGCHGWDDCCPDRDDFCNCGGSPFTWVGGYGCIAYLGVQNYKSAWRSCTEHKALLVTPSTEQKWTSFLNSDEFRDQAKSSTSFEYWINCIFYIDKWYWRTGRRTGIEVDSTWSNFGPPPTQRKKRGLICLGNNDKPWGYSKQRIPRHTFCGK